MAIDGSRAIGGSEAETIEFRGGVVPGIKPDDTFAAKGPTTFIASVMGASLFSGTQQALIVTGGNASSASVVRDVLGSLIRELVRNGTIKGSYSID
jgi:hypothetical protein